MNSVNTAEVNSLDGAKDETLRDRSIGDLIKDARSLSAAEVERVLAYQRERGLRFGEAAVALGLASEEDVMNALGQQFHYPMGSAERKLSSPELVVLNQPFSVQAEAFRGVRSQMMMRAFKALEASQRALAVVSPEGGDGKTFAAANLAVTLAQLGGRTLLVDADLRGPRQHDVFKVRNDAGLSGVLAGRAESQVIQQVDGVPGLFVLPGGVVPPNPLELIERPAFALLLRELMSKFDHVVVDTPAANRGADASVIAARCGHALIVTRKNHSRVSALQDLVASLAGTPAEVVGVLVNEF